MASVAFRNLCKSYGSVDVLRGLDLEIEEGEFVALVGPSGSGKSTLLRLLAGLEAPSNGEIFMNGCKVNDRTPRERNIAMVFQSYALYPHMTVRENISFNLRISGICKTEIKKQVHYAAEILDLVGLLERKPSQLSGGQRQRVAMGRAIVRNPEAFLFDEPLSNLDAKLRVQMREEIKRLHYSVKTTSVYVTHDQIEAMTLADRIVIIKDGLVQQIGNPRELYKNPANVFVAGFIGSPAMNLIDAELSNSGPVCVLTLPDGQKLMTDKLSLQHLPDGPVTVGVRPENLHLVKGQPAANVLDGFLELIEPIGASNHLKVAVGSLLLTVVDAELTPLSLKGRVKVSVDPQKVHLFPRSQSPAE